MSLHRPCYLPAGKYSLSQPFVLDVTPVRAEGIVIYGDGPNVSFLQFKSVASPAFFIMCSQCAVNSDPHSKDYVPGGHGAFFSTFKDFHISGSVAGTVLRVGMPASFDGTFSWYPDAMNGFTFDNMNVNNELNDPSANALEMNGIYESRIWMTTNNHGSGDSLRMMHTGYSTIGGSYSGASVGLHIAGDTYGNTFNNLDLEDVTTAVQIDGPAHNNTFNSGQYSLGNKLRPPVADFDATQGDNNIFITPNLSFLFQQFANGGANNIGVTIIMGTM